MAISTLHITNLRNIVGAKLECSPLFNLFFGDNGAGKTSVLESIYCLSHGKSFRTSSSEHVIHHKQNKFELFITLIQNNAKIPVGILRSRDGGVTIRIDGATTHSAAALSSYLPVQFIGSASHRILIDGPKARRQFLDWGLFYTQPAFYPAWKSFQKLLHHRNAALKARAPQDEILIWNHELGSVSETLHLMRQQYINELMPFFTDIIAVLLDSDAIKLTYFAGWDTSSSLTALLHRDIYREYQIGHTLHGPHRADLALSVSDFPAQEVLSQGQQKLLAYALKLSQGLHFQALTTRSPIYLIDDLPSELDSSKRALVTHILSKIQAQVFITGINAADFSEILALGAANRMFHVKHGEISEHIPENCFT